MFDVFWLIFLVGPVLEPCNVFFLVLPNFLMVYPGKQTITNLMISHCSDRGSKNRNHLLPFLSARTQLPASVFRSRSLSANGFHSWLVD